MQAESELKESDYGWICRRLLLDHKPPCPRVEQVQLISLLDQIMYMDGGYEYDYPIADLTPYVLLLPSTFCTGRKLFLESNQGPIHHE